jgi:hypothetical protein
MHVAEIIPFINRGGLQKWGLPALRVKPGGNYEGKTQNRMYCVTNCHPSEPHRLPSDRHMKETCVSIYVRLPTAVCGKSMTIIRTIKSDTITQRKSHITSSYAQRLAGRSNLGHGMFCFVYSSSKSDMPPSPLMASSHTRSLAAVRISF